MKKLKIVYSNVTQDNIDFLKKAYREIKKEILARCDDELLSNRETTIALMNDPLLQKVNEELVRVYQMAVVSYYEIVDE